MNFYLNGVIHNEKNTSFLKTLKSNDFYIDFFQDKDEKIYFYNRFGEVCLLDTANKVTKYNVGQLNGNSPENWTFCLYMYIHHLNKSTTGEFLFWTSCGIFKMKTLNGERTAIDSTTGVYGVFQSLDNNLYVNSINYGLIKYSNKFGKLQLPLPFDHLKVKTIVEDTEKNIWIAAFDKGVYCLRDGKIIRHFNIEKALGIIQDNENNIWVSSMVDGLYLINHDILNQVHYSGDNIRSEVVSMYKGYNNGIWCSFGDKICLFKGGSFKELILNLPHKYYDIILQIDKNSLYIGERSNKLFILKDLCYSQDEQSIFFRNSSKYPFNVKKIILDHKNRLLYTYDQSMITKSSLLDPILPTERIYIGERINNILVNNENKLIVNAANNYWISFGKKYEYSRLKEFRGSIFQDYFPLSDSKGELIDIDGDSIFYLNKNTSINLTKLFDPPVVSVIRKIIVNRSVLYFSSQSTVYYCFLPSKIRTDNKLDLRAFNVSFRKINDFLIDNDSLFIASSDGLTIIPLDSINLYATPPPKPYVKAIVVNGINLENMDSAIIVTGKNKIVLTFGCISYLSKEISYSYTLEGLDNIWLYSSGIETSILYQNLPAGNYLFKLKVRRANSNWSDPIILRVTIKPMFYETPVFWYMVFVVLALTTILSLKRFKYLQMKKLEVNNKLIILEQRALHFMMNPHFVFNSLSSVQNFLLKGRVKPAISYLSQFARLVRQNLIAVNKTYISMDDELERLRNYLDIEKIRMEDGFEYSITLSPEFDEDVFYIPSMLIQPFVENSILHGLSATVTGGIINIAIEIIDDKILLFTIEDNGIGIVNSSKNRLKRAEVICTLECK
ncbi:MAG: histidine kinase [Chitinophagaceae bacterium]|nr:histidine kinase [Chitinophagaceae bacterium]